MNSGIERQTRVRTTASMAPSGVDSQACGTWIRCSSSKRPLISPKRELKIQAQMKALTVLGTTHGISVSARMTPRPLKRLVEQQRPAEPQHQRAERREPDIDDGGQERAPDFGIGQHLAKIAEADEGRGDRLQRVLEQRQRQRLAEGIENDEGKGDGGRRQHQEPDAALYRLQAAAACLAGDRVVLDAVRHGTSDVGGRHPKCPCRTGARASTRAPAPDYWA